MSRPLLHLSLRLRPNPPQPRSFSSTPRLPQKWLPLPVLNNPTPSTFRTEAFIPEKPFSIPAPSSLSTLPAISTWFTHHANPPNHTPQPTNPPTTSPPTPPATLNLPHLLPHSSTLLDLEYTTPTTTPPTFTRALAPLSLFLSYTTLTPQPPQNTLTISQTSITLLPPPLQQDFPTPPLVSHTGTGDVYATNLWLGIAPTSTPLHRDPNPNLFLQMAGQKRVRLLEPGRGEEVWRGVRAGLGKAGREGRVRGEEMMVGGEREGLERWVWDGEGEEEGKEAVGYEILLGRGDGLFIPKGWWHSVRGVGVGVTGSVNWWFR